MREAKIILPYSSIWHNRIVEDITNLFGGCTVTDAEGSWKETTAAGKKKVHNDPVKIYSIACAELGRDIINLETIAHHYAKMLKQQAFYIQYPNGHINIEQTNKFIVRR